MSRRVARPAEQTAHEPAGAEPGADLELGGRDSMAPGRRQTSGSARGLARSGRAQNPVTDAVPGYDDESLGNAVNDHHATSTAAETGAHASSALDESTRQARMNEGEDYRKNDPSGIRTSGPVRGERGASRSRSNKTTGLGRGER